MLTRIANYLAFIIPIYFIGWTISYVMIAGSDFTYYWKWLVLGWTFNGLEMPSFAWLFSIVVTLFLWAAFAIVLWRWRRWRRSPSS